MVCGTGNNGGDGAAAARLLAERGYKVFVYLAGNPEKYSEQMRSQLKIAEKYPVTFVNSFEKGEYTVIIDAVFGVGLSRPVRGIFAETVEQINRSGSKVLAIDIPSGVDSDTGEILGDGSAGGSDGHLRLPEAGASSVSWSCSGRNRCGEKDRHLCQRGRRQGDNLLSGREGPETAARTGSGREQRDFSQSACHCRLRNHLRSSGSVRQGGSADRHRDGKGLYFRTKQNSDVCAAAGSFDRNLGGE